jgi:hypothetical protein
MDADTGAVLKWGSMGLLVGVIFTIMIGVNGGFLISKSNAERMAHTAVTSNQADICVSQFSNAPHHDENLKEFKSLSFMQRDEYIEKGGWDRMPGETKADSDVERMCAEKLAALVDK